MTKFKKQFSIMLTIAITIVISVALSVACSSLYSQNGDWSCTLGVFCAICLNGFAMCAALVVIDYIHNYK